MSRTLAIVGAGRVGRALGLALRERGWRIGAVVDTTKAAARAGVRAIGRGMPCAELTRDILAADVVLITTPDDVLLCAGEELARFGGAGWRGKVVLHTSGSHSHKSLAPLARCGAATAAMHPMQAFSLRGRPRLEGVVFGLDGHSRAVRVARRIATSLGGIPVEIRAAAKPAYHAAGGFAAPHVLATLEAGTQILMRIGFSRRQAARALLNLARETLANIERFGPRGARSGPLSRGDYGTLRKHVAVLRAYPPEFLAAYIALTRLGARLVAPRPAEVQRRLHQIFGKENGK
jgi:predicted short-subunit dehydrogenase-like oxidoreductase (DUF2520 family)